jgi:hypothetical protein
MIHQSKQQMMSCSLSSKIIVVVDEGLKIEEDP